MSFAGQDVHIGDEDGSVRHPRCSCLYANCRGLACRPFLPSDAS